MVIIHCVLLLMVPDVSGDEMQDQIVRQFQRMDKEIILYLDSSGTVAGGQEDRPSRRIAMRLREFLDPEVGFLNPNDTIVISFFAGDVWSPKEFTASDVHSWWKLLEDYASGEIYTINAERKVYTTDLSVVFSSIGADLSRDRRGITLYIIASDFIDDPTDNICSHVDQASAVRSGNELGRTIMARSSSKSYLALLWVRPNPDDVYTSNRNLAECMADVIDRAAVIRTLTQEAGAFEISYLDIRDVVGALSQSILRGMSQHVDIRLESFIDERTLLPGLLVEVQNRSDVLVVINDFEMLRAANDLVSWEVSSAQRFESVIIAGHSSAQVRLPPPNKVIGEGKPPTEVFIRAKQSPAPLTGSPTTIRVNLASTHTVRIEDAKVFRLPGARNPYGVDLKIRSTGELDPSSDQYYDVILSDSESEDATGTLRISRLIENEKVRGSTIHDSFKIEESNLERLKRVTVIVEFDSDSTLTKDQKVVKTDQGLLRRFLFPSVCLLSFFGWLYLRRKYSDIRMENLGIIADLMNISFFLLMATGAIAGFLSGMGFVVSNELNYIAISLAMSILLGVIVYVACVRSIGEFENRIAENEEDPRDISEMKARNINLISVLALAVSIAMFLLANILLRPFISPELGEILR
jgi:hypothetical protein